MLLNVQTCNKMSEGDCVERGNDSLPKIPVFLLGPPAAEVFICLEMCNGVRQLAERTL